MLNKVLDKIEREATDIDDVDYILEEYGIKILDFNEGEIGEVNIEVPDLEEVE